MHKQKLAEMPENALKKTGELSVIKNSAYGVLRIFR
jgi:hypothetical protein